MRPSEIKKEAREILKGKWLRGSSIVLAYTLVSFLLSFLGNLSTIIAVPLSLGFTIAFIKFKRNEHVKTWDFLDNGLSRFGKSWGITWHIFLKLLLPLICLLILIIILLISALNTFTAALDPALGMSGLLIVVLLLPLAAIWIYPKYFLYILSYNISYDNPELSSKECVLKSAELMRGNRLKYVNLYLSFIGWYILLILVIFCTMNPSLLKLLNIEIISESINIWSFVIPWIVALLGNLFLLPYIQVSTICFYDKLLKSDIDEVISTL